MPGAKNIVLGLVFMAAGSAVLVALDFGGGLLEWGGWGLAALGFVVFAGGVYQAVGPGSAGLDAEQAYKSSSTARLLMQSMLTTALADGHLEESELEAIAEACEEVVHEHLDPKSIRRIAEIVEKRGDAILEEIRYEGKMLNLDARKAIIDACVLVLMVDGDIDVRETAAVQVIGEQLGFSDAETQSMIDAALPAKQE